MILLLAGGYLAPTGTGGHPFAVHRPVPQPPANPYIPLNVTNAGNSATPTFEEKVVLPSADFATLINSNFTNVQAVYGSNQTPIYAWIEANASNTSYSTILWLRLYPIPAQSTVTVWLVCGPKGSFDLSESGYTGESPLLSANYSEFDNGWRVFDLYDNFSGSSLGPLWAVNGAWAVDVHDGVHFDQVPGDGTNITSQVSFAYPATVDFYGDLYQSWNAGAFMTEGFGVSACTSCRSQQGAGFDTQYVGSGPDSWAANRTSGVDWGGVPAVFVPTYGVFTTQIEGATAAAWEFNYSGASAPGSLYLPPSPEPVGLALCAGPAGALTNNQTTIWIREHPYVSNVSVEVPGVSALRVALTASASTVPAQQMLTLTTNSTGGAAAPYLYRYTGLPPGCGPAVWRTLTCWVGTPGVYYPQVTVTDGDGAISSAVTTVTVTNATGPPPPPPPVPLRATLYAPFDHVVAYSSFVLSAGGYGGQMPYRFDYSGLPAGCPSLDTGLLVCTPTTPGSYTIVLTLTDANGSVATASTTVHVAPLPTLTVNVTALPFEVEANATVVLYVSASGGQAPYSYSYVGLPAGCASADAFLLGCSHVPAGRYAITVSVQDHLGDLTEAVVNVTVLPGPAPVPPVATGGGSSGSLPVWELAAFGAGIVAAIALAAIAVALAARRRGPP